MYSATGIALNYNAIKTLTPLPQNRDKFYITFNMKAYKIVNTTSNDLEFIYWLFDEAIAYQKRNNYPVWKTYDKDILQKDIDRRLKYKIVSGDDITCIFSLCYAEPIPMERKRKWRCNLYSLYCSKPQTQRAKAV